VRHLYTTISRVGNSIHAWGDIAGSIKPGNTNLKGRLSTVALLIKAACFVTEVNNNFIIKMSQSKLVRTRRSSVLRLPL
jgi:hypothetical protein